MAAGFQQLAEQTTAEAMSKPHLTPLTRNRHIVLTIGTAVIALLTAIFIVGAPPIPAVVGATIAVSWLIWRAPAA